MGDNPFISFIKKVWSVVGIIGDIQTLVSIAAALWAAVKAARYLSLTWNNPEKVLLVAATFFTTWGAIAVLARTGKAVWNRWQLWRHPPRLELIFAGGEVGSLTLKHAGRTALWSVEGQILRTTNGNVNREPRIFECDIVKSRRWSYGVQLSEGEWAQVIIASIETSQWRSGSWLSIRHGSYDSCVNFDDGGVVMEFTVKAKPRLKGGVIKKQVSVTPNKQNRYLVDVLPVGD